MSPMMASLTPQAPKTVRLLLVEDDPEDAGFVESILKEGRGTDFSVHWVSSLTSARDLVTSTAFDIIILDLDLPDSRGMETLAQVRESVGSNVPIVVLSENDELEIGRSIQQLQDEAECLAKLHLDHRLVPRLLYHLIQRQRTQSSLQKLITTNPDGIVVVDLNGVVLFANPAASSLFGRPVSELLNHELGFPVSSGDAIEIDIGSSRVAEMRVVEIDWHDNAAWMTSLREITERKRMERELWDARLEAELASRAKTRFLACMSHELRTPLNAVIGFSEMIAQDSRRGNWAETCKEYAEIIHTSGVHLLDIVNDVLDVAAVEAGRIALDCQMLDVNTAVTSSMQMVSKMAMEKRIKIAQKSGPALVPLFADFRRIRQIIINLLSNSIKYTPTGGAVTIGCHHADDQSLILEIIDTGIGIPKEDMERLMTPFGRSGDPYVSRQQGTGLGLYITRLLVELHDGSISLSSVVNEGTTATVRFPAKRSAPHIT